MEVDCTKCHKPIAGRQHIHIVGEEHHVQFGVTPGKYHTKCCPLHGKAPVLEKGRFD